MTRTERKHVETLIGLIANKKSDDGIRVIAALMLAWLFASEDDAKDVRGLLLSRRRVSTNYKRRPKFGARK